MLKKFKANRHLILNLLLVLDMFLMDQNLERHNPFSLIFENSIKIFYVCTSLYLRECFYHLNVFMAVWKWFWVKKTQWHKNVTILKFYWLVLLIKIRGNNQQKFEIVLEVCSLSIFFSIKTFVIALFMKIFHVAI